MEKVAFALFNDSEDADVVVKCGIVQAEFRCHKFILSMASPVFKAMFKHATLKENAENVVEIVDFGPDAIETFLKLIYGDSKLKRLTPDTAKDVIVMCDKYDVKAALRENLESAIVNRFLTRTRDAAEFAVLGDKFDLVALRDEAIHRVADNFQFDEAVLKPLKVGPDVLFGVFRLVVEKQKLQIEHERVATNKIFQETHQKWTDYGQALQKRFNGLVNHVSKCHVCTRKGTDKCTEIVKIKQIA